MPLSLSSKYSIHISYIFRKIGEYKAKTAEDWISILDLSTSLEFADIRELSLKQLAVFELDPVDKIELVQKYQIERQWAYTSYIMICGRKEPLTVGEARRLGVDTTTRIALVREKAGVGLKRMVEEQRPTLRNPLELDFEEQPNNTASVLCEVFSLRPEKLTSKWRDYEGCCIQ